MRALKIAGILAIVSAACVFSLMSVGALPIPNSSRAVGETIGGWLVIFVLALIAAAIASVNLKSRITPILGPVVAGSLIAVGVAAVNYVGSLSP